MSLLGLLTLAGSTEVLRFASTVTTTLKDMRITRKSQTMERRTAAAG
jgi:hypothetical protein